MKKTLALCLALALSATVSSNAFAFNSSVIEEENLISAGFKSDIYVNHTGELYVGIDDEWVMIAENVQSASMGIDTIAYIKNDGGLFITNINELSTEHMRVADGVSAVSCGTNHVAAIMLDKTLWMMGVNDRGQLGTGGRESSEELVKVMDDVLAVSCGNKYTLVKKADNSLWAFGANTYGQLGTEDYTVRDIPTKVMLDVETFSAGYNHSLVVTMSGELYAFGDNTHGQLGNATNVTTNEIVLVGGNFTEVSAGYNCSGAVDASGVLYTWGDNTHMQLGINLGKDDIISPTETMSGVDTVSMGFKSSMVLLSNGLLYHLGNSEAPVLSWDNLLNEAVPSNAFPSTFTFYVDGFEATPNSYNINGNNYLKLREIAAMLFGHSKGFRVEYQETTQNIYLFSNSQYELIGTELVPMGNVGGMVAYPTTSKLFIDGVESDVLMYRLGDEHYVKLRDIAEIFDFAVEFDATTDSVYIWAAKEYAE